MKLTVLAAVVTAASLTTGSDALKFMTYNDHDPTLPNCNDVTIASPYGKNSAKCSCALGESKATGSLVKHKQIASWRVPYYEVECIPRRRSLRIDLGFGQVRLPPMCGPGYSLTGRPCKKPKIYMYDEDEDDDLGFGQIRLPPMCGPRGTYSLTGRPCKKSDGDRNCVYDLESEAPMEDGNPGTLCGNANCCGPGTKFENGKCVVDYFSALALCADGDNGMACGISGVTGCTDA